jgi:hypothetical protein
MLDAAHQADPNEFAKTSRMAAISGPAPTPAAPQRTQDTSGRATGPQQPLVGFGPTPQAQQAPQAAAPAPDTKALEAREQKAKLLLMIGGAMLVLAALLFVAGVIMMTR